MRFKLTLKADGREFSTTTEAEDMGAVLFDVADFYVNVLSDDGEASVVTVERYDGAACAGNSRVGCRTPVEAEGRYCRLCAREFGVEGGGEDGND